MQHKETITIPARAEARVVKTTCDLCRSELERAGRFETRETRIEMRRGANYGPEGGNTTTTTFDICCKCFNERLVFWFGANGVQPRVEETDW